MLYLTIKLRQYRIASVFSNLYMVAVGRIRLKETLDV